MLARLSYRYKVPITFSLIVLVVAAIVSGTLMAQAYRDSKRDLIAGAESLGKSLARTLAPLILHDDVWRTYESITAPFDSANGARQRTIIVLDSRGRIYASSDPKRFPVATTISGHNNRYGELMKGINSVESGMEIVDDNRLAQIEIALPISVEESRIGTLVLIYNHELFLSRFYRTVREVALLTLAILALLLPVGWYLGGRMAKPLTRLAQCMDKLGTMPADDLECDLGTELKNRSAHDELGRLWLQFARMIGQLKEKAKLEKEMVRSNRLAAIGRITSGIAHEINNPLGGMLNAISTFKRQGNSEPFVLKTVSLLERGLLQIQEIVAALLVQVKLKSQALTPADIDDIHTLMLGEIDAHQVKFVWQNDIRDPVPLPATMIRQILLNLLLNAVHAVHDRGYIASKIWIEAGSFLIEVENDGELIDETKMESLLEPFPDPDAQNNGLGLWVVYQILQQLKGDIEVSSIPGITRFHISLPLEQDYAAA